MTKSLKMASVYKIMTLNVGNSAALGGLISILNIEKLILLCFKRLQFLVNNSH